MSKDNLAPLITQCPNCTTRFKVTEDQLQIASGKVRCGACLAVFDGTQSLQLEGEILGQNQVEDVDAFLDELTEGYEGQTSALPAGEQSTLPAIESGSTGLTSSADTDSQQPLDDSTQDLDDEDESRVEELNDLAEDEVVVEAGDSEVDDLSQLEAELMAGMRTERESASPSSSILDFAEALRAQKKPSRDESSLPESEASEQAEQHQTPSSDEQDLASNEDVVRGAVSELDSGLGKELGSEVESEVESEQDSHFESDSNSEFDLESSADSDQETQAAAFGDDQFNSTATNLASAARAADIDLEASAASVAQDHDEALSELDKLEAQLLEDVSQPDSVLTDPLSDQGPQDSEESSNENTLAEETLSEITGHDERSGVDAGAEQQSDVDLGGESQLDGAETGEPEVENFEFAEVDAGSEMATSKVDDAVGAQAEIVDRQLSESEDLCVETDPFGSDDSVEVHNPAGFDTEQEVGFEGDPTIPDDLPLAADAETQAITHGETAQSGTEISGTQISGSEGEVASATVADSAHTFVEQVEAADLTSQAAASEYERDDNTKADDALEAASLEQTIDDFLADELQELQALGQADDLSATDEADKRADKRADGQADEQVDDQADKQAEEVAQQIEDGQSEVVANDDLEIVDSTLSNVETSADAIVPHKPLDCADVEVQDQDKQDQDKLDQEQDEHPAPKPSVIERAVTQAGTDVVESVAEPMAENLAAAENSPVGHVVPSASRSWATWPLIFLAIIGIPAQILWFQYDAWVKDTTYRPIYAGVCQVVGCELPELRDASLIISRKSVSRADPEIPDQRVVDVLMVNMASFAQPFPEIELTFSSLQGRKIASRVFKPSEYLHGELRNVSIMQPQTPVHISLQTKDPGRKAQSFRIEFK